MNALVTTPKDKALLLAQLLLVPAIVAGVPGNLWKLLALALVWALSFRRPDRQEWVMVAFACVFFTAMNAASLQQGIFGFSHPDLLGMPVFELFNLCPRKDRLRRPSDDGYDHGIQQSRDQSAD